VKDLAGPLGILGGSSPFDNNSPQMPEKLRMEIKKPGTKDEKIKLLKDLMKRQKKQRDDFISKDYTNKVSNYQLKQMDPEDIPRKYRTHWGLTKQVFNKNQQDYRNKRIGVDFIGTAKRIPDGETILQSPNVLYYPAKNKTIATKFKMNLEDTDSHY
jgi:hypothetical protein